jgi:hypothetical protein
MLTNKKHRQLKAKEFQIPNTRQDDSTFIFALYDDAITYQKKVGNNCCHVLHYT